MSEFYVGATEAESRLVLHAAIMRGITMFDTADMYGPFTNERFVGECLRPFRHDVIIATKFGYVRQPDGTRLGLNGRPEYVRSACDASLARLGVNHIDLYYLHRVDRTVPLEDTIGAMSGLVEAGKVRFIGLSEVTPQTLRRAHTTFPISAVQTEYSLVSRDPELELLGVLHELGIGFVAYAPLGRGLLTGRFQNVEAIPPNDYRLSTPRFASENLMHNSSLVADLARIASATALTPAQLALAWVAHKLSNGVVLAGTTSRERLIENAAAVSMDVSPCIVATLDDLFHRSAIRGTRYADMRRVDG